MRRSVPAKYRRGRVGTTKSVPHWSVCVHAARFLGGESGLDPLTRRLLDGIDHREHRATHPGYTEHSKLYCDSGLSHLRGRAAAPPCGAAQSVRAWLGSPHTTAVAGGAARGDWPDGSFGSKGRNSSQR